MTNYIEEHDGGYWIKGTRVSLDSVVYAFKRGASPETIKSSFPVLTLEEVRGAITYYLAHEKEIDAFLEKSEDEQESVARVINDRARASNPELFERLEKARQSRETRHR